MTQAGEILRGEISRSGPVSFGRFMDVALYHPECGYYRRGRDPFGKRGDYYTAEQLQPVFGILIAALVQSLFEEMGRPPDFALVELGAGRGEMASAFSGFRYHPVDVASGGWPERFRGVVFANEFFDALPVDVAVRRGNSFRQMRVDWRQERFVWTEGEDVTGAALGYLRRYFPAAAEGTVAEIPHEGLRWMEEIARRLEQGHALIVDYGYTAREAARFPRGTLMSYRRHLAGEDVLADPGDRDITAHVCFTALEECGARCGLEKVRLETLARMLLAAGEADGFAAALAAATDRERLERRLQLKTLLYGMGESFRSLLLRKAGQK